VESGKKNCRNPKTSSVCEFAEAYGGMSVGRILLPEIKIYILCGKVWVEAQREAWAIKGERNSAYKELY